jgi:hypothetical protein
MAWVGFAKALILARRLQGLATLRHSHGLHDISQGDCLLSELRVKIGNKGTFQEFNNAAAELTRICHFQGSASPSAVYVPSAQAYEPGVSSS